MHEPDAQSDAAAWQYQGSADLLGKPLVAVEGLAHLHMQLQGESDDGGASLRVWPDTTQSQTLHDLIQYLRLSPQTKAVLLALPNVPIISLAMQQAPGSDRHSVEIVTLKNEFKNNLRKSLRRNLEKKRSVVDENPDDENGDDENADANNGAASRKDSITYYFDVPAPNAQHTTTDKPHSAALTRGHSTQTLPLLGFQNTPLAACAQHALAVPLGGRLRWYLDNIVLPSLDLDAATMGLREAQLQLTEHHTTRPESHLSANLNHACVCLDHHAILRLQLTLEIQNNASIALPAQIDPTMLHQIEVIQGQGHLQFTQAIGPWSQLSVNANILPKKGLQIGPFPTIVTPNIAEDFKLIDALQSLAPTQFSLDGLAPLKAHAQQSQLRIIAHCDLWLQAHATQPLCIKCVLHFCLNTTPVFSIPLTLRLNPDQLDVRMNDSLAALTTHISTSIQNEYALVAQALVQDRYALACYLTLFTDAVDQLKSLTPQSVLSAHTQSTSYSSFWQALHRLNDLEPSATPHQGNKQIEASSLANCHARLHQITQIFCRNTTPAARPVNNNVPLSAQFYAAARPSSARTVEDSGSPNDACTPQITNAVWTSHNQQLQLTLAPEQDLQWVKHYRINIMQQSVKNGSSNIASEHTSLKHLNCQCYIPNTQKDAATKTLRFAIPRLWNTIEDVSIQLLAYGDPSHYTTPAVTVFHALREDLTTGAIRENHTNKAPKDQYASDQTTLTNTNLANTNLTNTIPDNLTPSKTTPSNTPQDNTTVHNIESNHSDQQHTELQSHKPFRPWVAHLSDAQIRLKWQTKDQWHYRIEIQDLNRDTVLSCQLDANTAMGGITLDRTLFNGAFPYQVWVSIQAQHRSQLPPQRVTENSANQSAFEPIFVNIPTLTVFRDSAQSQCTGCHWEKPNYPIRYYQAELFEVQHEKTSGSQSTCAQAALTLPCFQTQLPAIATQIRFNALSISLKPSSTYEFRLRAKLPEDPTGLFAWTPATVVRITPDDLGSA